MTVPWHLLLVPACLHMNMMRLAVCRALLTCRWAIRSAPVQLWCIFKEKLQSTGQCGLLALFPLSTLHTLSHYSLHSQLPLFDAFFIRAMITAIIATAVVINQLQSQYKTSCVWLDARQLSLSSTLPLLIFKWRSSGGATQKRISASWHPRAQLRGQGCQDGLIWSLCFKVFQW